MQDHTAEDLLRTLVAFPTVSTNPHANHECLEFIGGYLAQRGMFVQRFAWNGAESLVAMTRPHSKTPKVMLAAHADVVPADDSLFELRLEDGKYYGRGVYDMKFAIATYMQLVDSLQGKLQAYDFGIMVTCDEETGGRDGVARLVDDGFIPQVCILPDGGDNWQVQTASKGFQAFTISINGNPVHGSRPWLGDNAITKLLGVLDEIAALFPKVPSADTNTISLNRLNGGEAMNQVPAQASMTVDIRTVSRADHSRLFEEITAICHRNGATYQHISDGAPTTSDLNDPLIAPFARLVTKHTGTEQRGFHALGASDIRFFVPYGVPCISVYPAGGNPHAVDEWLAKDSLRHFYSILSDYLEQIARQ